MNEEGRARFPDKKIKVKRRRGGGDAGCSGCGYSIVGCLFWPCLFLFCIITGYGVTIADHYYHFSFSRDRGLELHDDDIGSADSPEEGSDEHVPHR